MKLNTKKTILVSFSFFLVLAFWQAYDTIVPLTLTNKFGLSQFWSGVIMAADNVLALFLLPFFGNLSDRTKSPLGRRTPYILGGTILASVATLALSFVDKIQYDLVMAKYQTSYDAVSLLYTKAKESGNVQEIQAAQEALEKLNGDVWNNITTNNIGVFIAFAVILFIILVAMSTFRSASVALMPDITPKPLRSKGNAVVNLVGYVGGILALALMMVTGSDSTYVKDYRLFFGLLVALMLGALIVHLLCVKENKWVKEYEESAQEAPPEEEKITPAKAGKLSPGEFKSLIFLLASVAFWWMGYNAVATKFSVYSLNALNRPAGIALTIGTVAAIVSFIPVGILSGKFGRKKTVMAGVVLLALSFILFCFVTPATPYVLSVVLFSLAGIAWATININSFPMVVELASHGNVGKYTGFYYTASMAAQVLTPMLSGLLMDYINMKALFPYSAICVCLSFVTMLFVKHGDTKLESRPKQDLLEMMDVDV